MPLSSRTIARLTRPFEGGNGPTHAAIDRVWLSAGAETYLPEGANKAERVRVGLITLRDGGRPSGDGQEMPPDSQKLARVAEDLALMLVSRGEVDEDDVADALEAPTPVPQLSHKYPASELNLARGTSSANSPIDTQRCPYRCSSAPP
jgi:hypothetical protein